MLLIFFLDIKISYSQSATIFNEPKEDSVKSNSLIGLSIYDLRKIKVSVVSRKEEEKIWAPAFTSIYQSEEISSLNRYTIADLANLTSGYSTAPTAYNEIGLETRGLAANSFENDKHLVLIDGIPVNFSRSNKAPVDSDLPLFFADRVEFLKGPSSAIYGAGAFYGVVNIVSKEPRKKGAFVESKIMRSNRNGQESRLTSNLFFKNDKGEFKINVGYYNRLFSADYLGDSTKNEFRYWDNSRSFFVNSTYLLNTGPLKGLKFGSILMDRTSGLGEFWWGPNNGGNKINWNSIVNYIKYDKTLSTKLSLHTYVKNNMSEESGDYLSLVPTNTFATGNQQIFSAYKRKTLNLEWLGKLDVNFSKNTNLSVGLNWDLKNGLGEPFSYNSIVNAPDSVTYTPTPTFTYTDETPLGIHTFSAFAQAQRKFDVLDGILLTGGFRHDYGVMGDYHFSQLSPRFASNIAINKNLFVKLLYSKALKVPVPKNIGLNNEAKSEIEKSGGDASFIKDVVAETFDTFEGGVTWVNKSLEVNGLAFTHRILNELQTSQVTQSNVSVNTFVNAPGVIKGKGVEVDIKWLFLKSNYIRANYSYAKVLDGGTRIENLPLTKINFFGKMSFGKKNWITFVLANQNVIGRFSTIDLKNYSLFDINTIAQVTSHLSIEFMVRNVTNQSIIEAGYNYQGYQLTIPKTGRNVAFTLNLNF